MVVEVVVVGAAVPGPGPGLRPSPVASGNEARGGDKGCPGFSLVLDKKESIPVHGWF